MSQRETTSNAFEAFLYSFEEGSHAAAYRQDFDLTALVALTGGERARALQMLRERLSSGMDRRVPRALAALGAPESSPWLREAFEHWANSSSMQAEIALALASISGDQDSLVDQLIEVLLNGRGWSGRNTAAHALRQHRGSKVTSALYRALGDEDRTVRINAFDSLLSSMDVPPPTSGSELLGLKGRIAAGDLKARSALRELLSDQQPPMSS